MHSIERQCMQSKEAENAVYRRQSMPPTEAGHAVYRRQCMQSIEGRACSL